MQRLDADEKATLGITEDSLRKDTALISESGLYAMVLKSRIPEAKAFRKWVTTDVLPSIRKSGVYMTPAVAVEVIEDPLAAARRFLGVAIAEVDRLKPLPP